MRRFDFYSLYKLETLVRGSKVADQQQIPSTNTTPAPIQVVIPFKDQVSGNIVKKRLTDLSLKIKTTIQPVFISTKLNEDLKF